MISLDLTSGCSYEDLQVINHGIPPALMAEFLKVTKKFFALSAEDKEAIAMKPGKTVGYGRLFETKKSVANWIDRLVLWTYGERQKLAEPCMPSKPEQFRYVTHLTCNNSAPPQLAFAVAGMN